MSNIIKVSLTIKLEGSTLIRQGSEVIETIVKEFNQNKKKWVEKVIRVEQNKFIKKPAFQTIKISEDSYKYMTSLDSSPMNPREWARMSKKQRLEFHLNKISLSLGGKSFTYVILED